MPRKSTKKLQIDFLNSLFILTVAACPFYSNAQTFFTDITNESGIHHQFVVYEGMFGGGACVFDFDQDGFEDVFITGGVNDDALYKNNGNGTFKNVYKESGLSASARYVTQGAACADVNRDGWVDLFVTTITTQDSVKKIPRAENLVFLNNGNSTFREVTKEYKLDQLMSFSTGACFGDFNKDGYPDLYIGNYFQDYDGPLSEINDATIVNSSSTSRGYLLENVGGKYFQNVYTDYGLSHKGFGFGAVFTDYDDDHDVDLLVNHDFGYKARPNLFLQNEYPEKYFKDLGKELNMDLKINAMGTAIGDYNGDGLFDYYVTNIRFNRFMVNQGAGKPFVDRAQELGMGFVSISWGANFADFDHDMDVDLFVANGDLNPNDVPMADFYFENDKGRFTDKAHIVKVNDYGIGRGSVVFDIENDGDLDLLVINQKPVLNYPTESITHLYRNDSAKGNWIKITLKGVTSEMQGIGSRVEVVVGENKMIREIDGGSSHISQNSVKGHFGLGNAPQIDSIIVKWLSGPKQVLINQKVNTEITLTEPILKKKSLSWWPIMGISTLAVVILFSVYLRIRRNH